MKPVSPVAMEPELRCGVSEVIYAKDQPQYLPLPALAFNDGLVVTRWGLSLWERVKVALGGSVYLSQLTFGGPLQPVKLTASIEDAI
jgi:hypothetical protein